MGLYWCLIENWNVRVLRGHSGLVICCRCRWGFLFSPVAILSPWCGILYNYYKKMQLDQRNKSLKETEFFTDYGDANRYKILEVVGRGSYGVVGSAIDTHTGEKVAIKKINDIFEHTSDAIRILREVKLLRLLRLSGLLSSYNQKIRALALDCVLEIGYFGRKEAIEAMMDGGLVERPVELQRSNSHRKWIAERDGAEDESSEMEGDRHGGFVGGIGVQSRESVAVEGRGGEMAAAAEMAEANVLQVHLPNLLWK